VRRQGAPLVGGALCLVLLAGCAGLPERLGLPAMPSPVPSDVVPTDLPAPAISAGDTQLSPDGFDVVRRMAVRIRNVGCGELSTGSGFALTEYTLVTNKHVVADSAQLELSTYDGRDVDATAASTAGLADLAIVRTAEPLPAAPELATADPVEGDPVTIVGYPLGGRLTVTDGVVVGTTTDPLNATLGEVLITDAPVEPGSSGSAALDAEGRVIGVVYAKNDSGFSFLVPVSTLRAMLDDESAFAPAPTCAG
jgi:S1-C subfamily serine protease